MIVIEQIPVSRVDEFWERHLKYLVEDGIIEDDEDIAYFSGQEYRGIILANMLREKDRHRMAYFVEDGRRVGACQYNTYSSQDGKCFILDFWVFPEYRGVGTGHRCFAALADCTRREGARYYELNSEKPNAVRFWKSLGFEENGRDEYDMPLYVMRPENLPDGYDPGSKGD